MQLFRRIRFSHSLSLIFRQASLNGSKAACVQNQRVMPLESAPLLTVVLATGTQVNRIQPELQSGFRNVTRYYGGSVSTVATAAAAQNSGETLHVFTYSSFNICYVCICSLHWGISPTGLNSELWIFFFG